MKAENPDIAIIRKKICILVFPSFFFFFWGGGGGGGRGRGLGLLASRRNVGSMLKLFKTGTSKSSLGFCKGLPRVRHVIPVILGENLGVPKTLPAPPPPSFRAYTLRKAAPGGPVEGQIQALQHLARTTARSQRFWVSGFGF